MASSLGCSGRVGLQSPSAARCPGLGSLRRPVLRACRPTSAPSTVNLSAQPLQAAPVKGLGAQGLAQLRPVRAQKRQTATQSTAAAGADVPASKKSFLGIEAFTWQKIVPLGLMFFCILFNYTILRDTKDVLVVTAPGSGAEIIPFLKTWVNLPMAIGFTVLYAKVCVALAPGVVGLSSVQTFAERGLVYAQLANILSTEALFYVCILPFVAFFGSFAFILYPMRDTLHPTQFCERLLENWGARFGGPIAILRNWTFCLFYVMAELWGSVVVSLLFWGFANQITSVDEAKTFYPLFGLGANVALIFSGRAVKYFSEVRSRLPEGVDGWAYSLRGMMGMVVIGGFLITGIYWFLQRTVVPRVKAGQPKKKKQKMKLGMGDSFKVLASKQYIRDLAMLVVAYGISINLVEVTWKSKIKQQFPNPNDYSSFMGDFSTATGAVTFTMMILSRWIFKKFGWGVAALITPTVLLITGILFFALVLGSGPLTPTLAAMGFTPLMAAVLVGAAQNVFSKSSKYSLFDPCKEMAYIPLDQETQLKGKAAIDVVCNPLGKSGGAFIQQIMIVSFGSLAASTPYLGVILLGIVLVWMGAARSLNKQFTELQVQEMQAKLAESKAALPEQETFGATKKFKLTSAMNSEGFIETKYVPLDDGESVTASMDIVDETTAMQANARRNGGNGNGVSQAAPAQNPGFFKS